MAKWWEKDPEVGKEARWWENDPLASAGQTAVLDKPQRKLSISEAAARAMSPDYVPQPEPTQDMVIAEFPIEQKAPWLMRQIAGGEEAAQNVMKANLFRQDPERAKKQFPDDPAIQWLSDNPEQSFIPSLWNTKLDGQRIEEVDKLAAMTRSEREKLNKSKGTIKTGEHFGEKKDPREFMLFSGVLKFLKSNEFKGAVERLQQDDYTDEGYSPEKARDQLLVRDKLLLLEEMQDRGLTLPAIVLDSIANMAKYAGEIYLMAGLIGGGVPATQLGKVALAGKMAAMNVGDVAALTAERMTDKGYIGDEGEFIKTEEGQSLLKALPKSFLEQTATYWTEQQGEVIGKYLKNIGGKILTKLPKGLASVIMKSGKLTKPFYDMLRKGKLDGMIPELVEEYIDRIIKPVLMVDEQYRNKDEGYIERVARSMIPDPRELLIQTLTFSVMPIAGHIVGIAGKIGTKTRQSALTPETAAQIVTASPEIAAEIAQKEAPSRKDFRQLGITGLNAAERQEFTGLLKQELERRKEQADASRAGEEIETAGQEEGIEGAEAGQVRLRDDEEAGLEAEQGEVIPPKNKGLKEKPAPQVTEGKEDRLIDHPGNKSNIRNNLKRQDIDQDLFTKTITTMAEQGKTPNQISRTLDGMFPGWRQIQGYAKDAIWKYVAEHQDGTDTRSLTEILEKPQQVTAEGKAGWKGITKVQRIEEPGIEPSIQKPQGLYTTPSDIKSPHADLGGKRTEYVINPKANVLELRIAEESAGINALRTLEGDKRLGINLQESRGRITTDLLSKQELIDKVSQEYPNIDWTQYTDQQEILEGYAGLLARKKGYDAIWSPDKNPSFNEFVLLTDKAVLPPAPQVTEGKMLYHGTSTAKAEIIKQEGFKAGMKGKMINNLGISLSKNKVIAGLHSLQGKKGGEVLSVNLSADAKIYTIDDVNPSVIKRGFATTTELIFDARDRGFDGIDFDSLEESGLIKGGRIGTKEQEVLVWNTDALQVPPAPQVTEPETAKGGGQSTTQAEITQPGEAGGAETVQPPETKTEAKEEKPAKGKQKRIISKEAYEASKKRLLDPTKLRMGLGPQDFADLVTVGAYHFESGIRKFVEWSAKMIEEFGERVGPYLRDVYDQITAERKPKKGTKASKEFEAETRERGFITSVKETFPKMADKIAGQYIPRSTDELSIKARNLIKDDIDTAEKLARTETNDKAVATACELIIHYNELAEATTDKAAEKAFYEKAADIAHSVAANLTELGRAVQAASLLGRMTPEGHLRFAARTINAHNEKLKRGRKRIPNLTPEQTKEILERARVIEKMPDGEGKAKAFWDLQNHISELVPTPLWKKLINVWKAGLLTGIKTSGLNTFSNLAHGITEVVKDVLAAGFDIMFSLLTKKRTIGLTARGVPSGLKNGAERGWRYLKTGFDERNVAAKLDYHRVNMGKSKFARTIGAYTDAIFRIMGAEDQPFYYGALARSLYSQAIAEAKNKGLKGQEAKTFIENLVENPTDTILNYAVNDALIAVYQNQTLLGKIGKKFQEMPVIGEVIAPFVRTPSAVAMQIINYSPVGAIKTIIENIGKGRFDQRLLSQGLARGLLGTGILYLGTQLFKMGLIALGRPKGEREKKLWEIEGRKPNSIKIGGKWRDMQVLGPIGPLLLIGGYFQQALESTGSPTEAMATAITGGAKSFSEQTFVRGVNAAASAVADPERSFDLFFASLAGSTVPTIISDIARAKDTTERRSKGAVQRIQVRIPGLREQLEPQIDVFGNDLPRYGGNVLEVMLDPTRPFKIHEDVVVDELRRLWDEGHKVSPTQLGYKYGYEFLTPEENTEMWHAVGSLTYERLHRLLQQPEYKRYRDEAKAKAIENTVDNVKEYIKKRFRITQRKKAFEQEVF